MGEAVKVMLWGFGLMFGVVMGAEAAAQVQRYIRHAQAEEDDQRLQKAADSLAEAHHKIRRAIGGAHVQNN